MYQQSLYVHVVIASDFVLSYAAIYVVQHLYFYSLLCMYHHLMFTKLVII